MASFPVGMHWWFEAMDSARRARSAAMDRAGLGPDQSESEIILAAPGFRLRWYGGSSERIALIVPAPIKRHTIWDLDQDCSVVRKALSDGMQVYLVEWLDPDATLARAGLDQYAGAWIDACVDAICDEHPSARPILFSHSLGGVLSTIYAALHPHRVGGLVLVEVPLHFGKASGSLFPLVAAAPPVSVLTDQMQRVPGSLISMVSAAASPATFQAERSADFFASLTSRSALRRHMLVERWTLDEMPMAARLFEQVVEDLYRNDNLMHGQLVVNGCFVGPALLQTPVLAIVDPRSLIIPPVAATRFLDSAAGAPTRLLQYEGDVGVALSHVGALVGPEAHRKLWPSVLAWTRSVQPSPF